MRPEFHLVDVRLDATPGPTSEGTSFHFPEVCIDHTIQVSGTFNADLRIEVSNDGATWVQIGAFTAPGMASYAGKSFKRLRVRTNAFVSGAPVVNYGGMNVRVEA